MERDLKDKVEKFRLNVQILIIQDFISSYTSWTMMIVSWNITSILVNFLSQNKLERENEESLEALSRK